MDPICEDAVDTYLRRYGWGLLARDELLAAVAAEYRAREPGPAAARAATLLCYSRALHGACSGAEGPERLERGYAELYGFLGRAAARRYPRVAGEATQSAVERVFLAFDSCRQPETFLAFVLQKLRDAARAELRGAARSAELLPVEMLDGVEAGLGSAGAELGDPALAAERAATRASLCDHALAFIARHPRAASQFAAVWLKYIGGLDDRAIARRLGRTPAAVQVLRSRALRRLRAEPAWRQLAGELGLG
jgi:DNA-directed RNA polymerase specialized sigma24 family protein